MRISSAASRCRFQWAAVPGMTRRARRPQHRGPRVHSQNPANVGLRSSRSFRVLGVSAGVPSLACGGHSKAWDSPLVHPAEAVLPVSHVIHSVRPPASFLALLLPAGPGGGGGVTPLFRVMFLCLVLHVLSVKCDPSHGLSGEASAMALGLHKPPPVAPWFAR